MEIITFKIHIKIQNDYQSIYLFDKAVSELINKVCYHTTFQTNVSDQYNIKLCKKIDYKGSCIVINKDKFMFYLFILHNSYMFGETFLLHIDN